MALAEQEKEPTTPFLVRLPVSLRVKLRAASEREDRTMAAITIRALRDYLEDDE